jgi:RNA polymerase sigma-70 factor, ECF subfamily
LDHTTLSSQELVRACLESSNEAAWAEFVSRFQPLIASVVLRVARKWGENSSQVVDDLIQETYLKLCEEGARPLQTFKPTHADAIYGYLKVFATNLAQDHFKAARSAKRGGHTLAVPIGNEVRSSPSQHNMGPQFPLERDVLIRQIDSCLQAVSTGPSSERDRKIFWLYYRVGLTASAVAALPSIGLTTKGVESTILRLTRLVRERLCARAAESKPNAPKGMQARDSF